MLREFEIVYWAALNTQEEIDNVVKNSQIEQEPSQKTMQAVRSRLVMTAYYSKGKLSGARTQDAIREFFSHNFDEFTGKHAAWSKDPPDTSKITPRVLNATKLQLIEVYR